MTRPRRVLVALTMSALFLSGLAVGALLSPGRAYAAEVCEHKECNDIWGTCEASLWKVKCLSWWNWNHYDCQDYAC